MQIARFGLLAATLFLFTACVTINIYFPAAQAEEAAERIVDDILGKKKITPSEADKGAALEQPFFLRMASGVLDFLIPAAHARFQRRYAGDQKAPGQHEEASQVAAATLPIRWHRLYQGCLGWNARLLGDIPQGSQ